MESFKFIIVMLFLSVANASSYTMERGSSLHLRCPGDIKDPIGPTVSMSDVMIGIPGKPGKRGPQGPSGAPGRSEPESDLRRRYDDRIHELERQLSEKQRISDVFGTVQNPAPSCHDIIQSNASVENGLYYIIDTEHNVFLTYCDMVTGGGGWTLVGSLHENNMKGRCTSGDRWSSEQGNSAEHPHGDGFWENRAVHGSASSATSDDYKSSGYFGLKATDIMIWHVPNDTPLNEYESGATLKYYTRDGFLRNYGGNLQKLFSVHYPMRSKTYTITTGNGPAIPIVWSRGNNAAMLELISKAVVNGVDAGFIQFRAINHERNAFALCPGVRIKANYGHVEHMCYGSTSYNIGHQNEENYCGDLAGEDWHADITSRVIESVIMIFYR